MWKASIQTNVDRYIKSGKSRDWISTYLASDAGRSAEAVRKYVDERRKVIKKQTNKD
jgi:hypothetical protein